METKEKDVEDVKEETAFATFCFLNDLNDMRLFVHQTWREYKEYVRDSFILGHHGERHKMVSYMLAKSGDIYSSSNPC